MAGLDQRLARTSARYTRILDALPLVPAVAADRAFADIDFPRTRAYSFATGGQVYLGESAGAVGDTAYAERLATELEAERHPETGEPLLHVLRKADIYHGPYLDRAPDLIVLTIDERVHVDSLRLRGVAAIEVHDHLDPENAYGYSGHHGVDGILAAAGPGIRPGVVPAGSGIVQMAATILRLHGVAAEGLDGAPIEAILAAGRRRGAGGGAGAGGERGGRLQRRGGGRHPRAAARPRLRVSGPRLQVDAPASFAGKARYTLETLLGACAVPAGRDRPLRRQRRPGGLGAGLAVLRGG